MSPARKTKAPAGATAEAFKLNPQTSKVLRNIMNSTVEVTRALVAPHEVSGILGDQRLQMRKMKALLSIASASLIDLGTVHEDVQERLYSLLDACEMMMDRSIAEALEGEAKYDAMTAGGL
jgi:hypothetical protein